MPLQKTPPQFRWLFIADFSDGSELKQTPEDVLPDSNQFKGVVERLDDLKAFSLAHVDRTQLVTVDLVTGNFIVNGTPVCIHNQRFDPSRYKLELVYFREKVESQTRSVRSSEVLEEQSFVSRYFIGWKTTVNGKDKQVTLAVG